MKDLINISLIIFLSSVSCFAKESKQEEHNRKIVENEEHRFQKDLRKKPQSAATYLDHANNLAAINSEVERAKDFYEMALKIDSANPQAYKDFGKYLADRLHKFDDASGEFAKSLSIAPGDEETFKYLRTVDKILAMQREEDDMRDFGTTTVRELEPGINYAALTRFDSLRSVIADPGSSFSYPKLITRFFNDDSELTPSEMYMLIVGFSRQKTYNPFNYNDIYALRSLSKFSVDSAIVKGLELTKDNPLNPSLNRELMFYYRKKNDTIRAGRYLRRIHQFFSGVLYSGNGSCERPYVSLWAKEEYNFINYLGYKSTENHSMGTCAGQMAEIIDVVDPATRLASSIHFNVALIYMQTVGK